MSPTHTQSPLPKEETVSTFPLHVKGTLQKCLSILGYREHLSLLSKGVWWNDTCPSEWKREEKLASEKYLKMICCWLWRWRKERSAKVCSTPFSSVQSLGHVQLFATPRIAACQTSLSITNSWSLVKLMFIALVMPSNHLILCHPLLLPPSILPIIRVFSNEMVLRIR